MSVVRYRRDNLHYLRSGLRVLNHLVHWSIGMILALFGDFLALDACHLGHFLRELDSYLGVRNSVIIVSCVLRLHRCIYIDYSLVDHLLQIG